MSNIRRRNKLKTFPLFLNFPRKNSTHSSTHDWVLYHSFSQAGNRARGQKAVGDVRGNKQRQCNRIQLSTCTHFFTSRVENGERLLSIDLHSNWISIFRFRRAPVFGAVHCWVFVSTVYYRTHTLTDDHALCIPPARNSSSVLASPFLAWLIQKCWTLCVCTENIEQSARCRTR